MTEEKQYLNSFIQYPIRLSVGKTVAGYSFRSRIYRLSFTILAGRVPWAKYLPRFRVRIRKIWQGVRIEFTVRPIQVKLEWQWLMQAKTRAQYVYSCPICTHHASLKDFRNRLEAVE